MGLLASQRARRARGGARGPRAAGSRANGKTGALRCGPGSPAACARRGAARGARTRPSRAGRPGSLRRAPGPGLWCDGRARPRLRALQRHLSRCGLPCAQSARCAQTRRSACAPPAPPRTAALWGVQGSRRGRAAPGSCPGAAWRRVLLACLRWRNPRGRAVECVGRGGRG